MAERNTDNMIPTKGMHQLFDRDYFAINLPSSSTTKNLMTQTNCQAGWERENKEDNDNDAFAIGALVHAMILTPKAVETDFIRTAAIDRRTTAGKLAHDTLQKRAALSGARIVTDEQFSQASEMVDAVRRHPAATALIDAITGAEITIIGTMSGRPAKAKIDAIIDRPDGIMIIDLKTTISAAPNDFATSAARFGYFHQAAWYRAMVEEAMGRPVAEFVTIAIEKTAPYQVALYAYPEMAIEIASRRIPALVRRWWDIESGDRTGYAQTITELTPPRWWISQESDTHGND